MARKPRSLPRLAFRNHAPANPRRRRDCALSRIPAALPDGQKLAAARETSVLAAWSGLGYYRRARMLHAAAKVVVRQLDGNFPTTAEIVAGIARSGSLHRGRDRQHRVRRTGRGGRWKCRTSSAALFGPEDCRGRFLVGGRPSSRSPTPGRFQSGDDGVGRHRMHAASARLSDLPGRRPVRDPRRIGEPCESSAAEEARDSLCAGFSHQRRFPARQSLSGPAPARRAPDGRHVGIAGNSAGTKAHANGATQIAPLKAPRPNASRGTSRNACLTLKHSITVTDYTVRVWPVSVRSRGGKWVPAEKLHRVALTGLARKTLRKAGISIPPERGAASSKIRPRP